MWSSYSQTASCYIQRSTPDTGTNRVRFPYNVIRQRSGVNNECSNLKYESSIIGVWIVNIWKYLNADGCEAKNYRGRRKYSDAENLHCRIIYLPDAGLHHRDNYWLQNNTTSGRNGVVFTHIFFVEPIIKNLFFQLIRNHEETTSTSKWIEPIATKGTVAYRLPQVNTSSMLNGSLDVIITLL